MTIFLLTGVFFQSSLIKVLNGLISEIEKMLTVLRRSVCIKK